MSYPEELLKFFNKRWGLLVAALAIGQSAQAAWTALAHQPTVPVYAYFLLMDGRVLANECDANGLGTVRWWTLSPDANGSYQNGTWAQVGSTTFTHLYFASTITPDGRVLVAGGEYSTGGSETNKCEIFNPVSNTWSQVTPPAGWSSIGDAPSATLPDGRMIMGDIFSNRTAIFDPVTTSFSPGPNKLNSRTTEETWVVLPDGTVGTWDCFGHPGSERFLPSSNLWINCGNTPVDLVLPGSFETGPGIVLPDGRMFAIGGTPKTCFYQFPPVLNQPGTWTVGPVPQNVNGRTVGAEDAPAVLLPNGNVLMPLSPVTSQGGTFEPPTYFFEFDGTNINRIADPPNASDPVYFSRLLLLPTGETLWTSGNAAGYLYTNGGGPNPAWKPAITGVNNLIEKNVTQTMTGTQLTGLSNGCSYGDEYDPSTNYPVVRMTNTNTGNVFYLRTFNPSTRRIQTGAASVTANFLVGSNVPVGNYNMQVTVNGIASDNVAVTVPNSIPPRAFTVIRGTLVSGGLNQVSNSDDQYLIVNKGIVIGPNDSPLQVSFAMASPTMSPTGLHISLEDGVNSSGLTRTIWLLNVQTNQYEAIASGAASQTDTLTIADASGNLARFVDQSNGTVTTKVSYYPTGPTSVSIWQARFDRVALLVN
ncbi:MAG: hypothetical protein JSS66_03965 [Armatimonadetes bacterium]|nr:hypothetical protein [Armatimonadota bacterium]